MASNSKKKKIISRRGILPILGGSLLIPFLGFGKPDKEEAKKSDSREGVSQSSIEASTEE